MIRHDEAIPLSIKNDSVQSLEHAVAEELLACRALVLELLVGQALDMAVDVAAVLHHVVAFHDGQVFARVVFVRAAVDWAEMAVGLLVVAVRRRHGRFLEGAQLAGIVASAAVPDMGLLRGVVQLFERRYDNAFAIGAMPVADRFVAGGAGHDLVVAIIAVQLFPPPRAGLRAIDLRHGVVIVACVHECRRADLFQIGLAAGGLGFVARLRQRRQQHGRQNGDDRDDDEQFNQRKASFLLDCFLHVHTLSYTVLFWNRPNSN